MPIDFHVFLYDYFTTFSELNISHTSLNHTHTLQLASGLFPEVLTPLKTPPISHFPERRAESAKSLHGIRHSSEKKKAFRACNFCDHGPPVCRQGCVHCISMCPCVCVLGVCVLVSAQGTAAQFNIIDEEQRATFQFQPNISI